ncbi:MAG: ribonuclease HII [Bacteroidetes bacterium]|nr:ribonuclease HII [Bacteroidota bacterium]
MALIQHFTVDKTEAGCDEAGRGCLAGPVFAAAVIFARNYANPAINDSKKLNASQREILRQEIEKSALAWAVASASPEEIDEINILNASFLAMHRALEKLSIMPQWILVDGHRFCPFKNIPYSCIIRGDAQYLSIAAASILAKTYRDDYMEKLHDDFSIYNWKENKGYPTKEHKAAILNYGITSHHRKSFNLGQQLELSF